MKFLIDQQLPRALAALLNRAGHEAIHVRDLELEFAADRDIWNAAARIGAAIISKDEDFSGAARRASGPQVVWVRLGNCSNERLLTRFKEALPDIVIELSSGAPLVELR